MMYTPLEQFDISRFLNLYILKDFSITNSSITMILVSFILVVYFIGSLQSAKLIPNGWQWSTEQLYKFILNLVDQNIGKEGKRYFPFIFFLFVSLLFYNLAGMVPYTFTVTSHIVITFGLALAIFIGINIIGINKHKLHFFSLFVPQGSPKALLPFLSVIEVVSYIFRVFSLSIRLFANMMSGHTLLKIMAGFTWTLLNAGGFLYYLSIVPFAIVFALTGLEIGIAILQAYVFTILVCIYLNDVIHLH
uniref:ATP synthase F0 subunit a n=1 Tax=Meteora sporadica TaxID=2913902 RepID=UPI0030017642|nr:ATP synthase F0 subunit a [Meteora sporadica]WVH37077.1 ATP synthase F0 subunit a [Meteora sporadica]